MALYPIFVTAFNAIIPIVLIIGIGFFLRQKGMLTEEFIKVGNKLGFQILLPIMLFLSVYSIESFSAIRWDVVIYCVAMQLLLFVLGYVSVGLTTRVHKRRGVILQNIFRSNVAIIGMSLTSVLGNAEALAITAVVLAFIQPVMNTLAVVSLSIYSDDEGQKISLADILKKVATNPLIHGILIGMLCLALRSAQKSLFGEVVFSLQRDMRFLYTALNNLKSITSPFMLLILGGQFNFTASKGMLREIVTGTLWRVVIAPVLCIGLAIVLSAHTKLINFGPEVYPSLIALFGSPTAVSSAIMAGQMGHDHQLATQLVVWTSVASIFTMFVTVCILMSVGLLAI